MKSSCSYNVGCTKRMGLFPNRKTTLENMKKQKTLNGSHKNGSLEPKKKVSSSGVITQRLFVPLDKLGFV